MNTLNARSVRCLTGLLVAVLTVATLVIAGPPLICHSMDIGQAKSLPWISHTWNLSGGENYDLKRLVPDTLSILDANTPVIVRMETIRRATLYARQDPQAARELLSKLVARSTEAENTGHPDALAHFDAGYLIETYKQWIGRNLPHMTDNMRMDPNPAVSLDGYALVRKAISLRGQDPEMEFAAALITLEGPEADHREHVLKAIAGSKSDSLLAQNLNTRFLGNGTTVAEVFSKDAKVNH